jgi:uncharacterized membrane protein
MPSAVWLVTQVCCHLPLRSGYYRPTKAGQRIAEGLDFPAATASPILDFSYFATSLARLARPPTSPIHTKALRRLVTLHAVISFFFNTAVLALAINIGAS